jgi:hypothetical protein
MSRRVVYQGGPAWLTFGGLLAFLVLVVSVIFLATGTIDLKIGLLIAVLALAVCLP